MKYDHNIWDWDWECKNFMHDWVVFLCCVLRILKKMTVLAIHSKMKQKRNKVFETFRSMSRSERKKSFFSSSESNLTLLSFPLQFCQWSKLGVVKPKVVIYIANLMSPILPIAVIKFVMSVCFSVNMVIEFWFMTWLHLCTKQKVIFTISIYHFSTLVAC